MITTYTYDNANRLQLANAGGSLTTYTHDPAGNRLSRQTSSETTAYTWDAAGRMITAEVTAGTVTFTYNADGQRSAKQSTDASVVGYLYDYKKLLAETDDVGGDVSALYATSTDQEFGDLIGEDGQFTHQFDAEANTNALLDVSGAVEATYKYYAFGNVASFAVEGDAWTSLTVDQWASMSVDDWAALPLELSTQMLAGGKKQYYFDPETELYLLGTGTNGRYYDAGTGRFTSEDPIRQASGDPNLYPYVQNNPVNHLDPSGHDKEDDAKQKREEEKRRRREEEARLAADQARLKDLESRKNYADSEAPGGKTEQWLWEQVKQTKKQTTLDKLALAFHEHDAADATSDAAAAENAKQGYDPTKGMAGTGAHIFQGGKNAVNGLQDVLIGTVNLVPRLYDHLAGNAPDKWTLPSPDWSKAAPGSGISDSSHDLSKALGGQALFTLATAGASSLLGLGTKGAQIATAAKVVTGVNTGIAATAGAVNAIDAAKDFKHGNTSAGLLNTGAALLNIGLTVLGAKSLTGGASEAPKVGSPSAEPAPVPKPVEASPVEPKVQASPVEPPATQKPSGAPANPAATAPKPSATADNVPASKPNVAPTADATPATQQDKPPTAASEKATPETASPPNLQATPTAVEPKISAEQSAAKSQTADNTGISSNQNRGLTWTTENTGKSSAAKDWEAKAPGAEPANPETGQRKVPALRYDNPNIKGNNVVRFDGVDPNNPKILIDRKWSVTTKPDQVDKFVSGPLKALEQNPEYRLRIEVPTRRAAVDAQRLIRYATGQNAHPQIDIVIVSPQ